MQLTGDGDIMNNDNIMCNILKTWYMQPYCLHQPYSVTLYCRMQESYPKLEGESAYGEPLWATACMRSPKCQVKVICMEAINL